MVVIRRIVFASMLFAGLGAVAPGALAQTDVQYLQERLNRLENDLRGLQRQVYRGGGAPPASGAAPGLAQPGSDEADTSIANRLSSRIDQLESQIRDLVGRLEEVEFKNTQTVRRVEKLSEDVDFRLNQIERTGTPGAGTSQAAASAAGQPAAGQAAGQNAPAAVQEGGPQQLARGSTSSTPGVAPTKEGVLGSLPVDAQGRPLPPAATTAPAARAGQPVAAAPAAPAAGRGKLPNGTPKERYDYAYKLLVQSDYADAEAAFREFVASHPSDNLAGNAQYWLGETYYVRQLFEPAAAAFLKGYQGYPKGAKASDSLLKLGMSLSALKKNAEACAAFGQLAKDFPNAPPHVKDAAGRERAKAGCR